MFRELKEILKQSCAYININFAIYKDHFISQSCPKCGAKHKPQGRNFHFPRDGVGAINIYCKYQNKSLALMRGLLIRSF